MHIYIYFSLVSLARLCEFKHFLYLNAHILLFVSVVSAQFCMLCTLWKCWKKYFTQKTKWLNRKLCWDVITLTRKYPVRWKLWDYMIAIADGCEFLIMFPLSAIINSAEPKGTNMVHTTVVHHLYWSCGGCHSRWWHYWGLWWQMSQW